VEYAIASGAVYHAGTDRWTTPAGMSDDALRAAIVDRLRVASGGEAPIGASQGRAWTPTAPDRHNTPNARSNVMRCI